MNLKRILALGAALLLSLSLTGPALADPSPDTTSVQVEITAGTQFSVDITSSLSDFGDVPFALGWQACNWGCMAYYNYSVTDMRGTGAGWQVNAQAGNFTGGPNNAVVPGANLFRSNEVYWNPGGFTAAPGSVSAGVTVGAQDSPTLIMNSSSLIIKGTTGVSGVTPNATGTFSAKESMWFTFPDSVAAGTYTSTLTLTLTSGNTP